MENNPIYDFLKANNLTSKDESSFISEYSDPAKAKELHDFFVQNNLTTKKFDDFYGEYFDVKKKDQQIPYGGQAFGGKEEKPLLPLTSSTVSPSVSSQPKSTTPSVSTEGVLKGNKTTAATPQDFVKEIQKASDKAIVETAPEEPSFGNELFESARRGSAALGGMIANTPSFIYTLAAYPQNKIAEMTGLPIGTTAAQLGETLGIPENEVANYYEDFVKQSQAKVQQKYDKGVTEYLFGKNPDYEKGFKLLANQVVEAAPISISMMMGNAAGVSALGSTLGGGVVFGAGKMQELEGKPMSESEKVENALSTGLLEGVFEQFGVSKLGSVIANIYKKEGKDAAIAIAEKGFKDVFLPALKKYVGIGAEESIGEAATQWTQNWVTILSGEDPNLDPMKGVVDAATVGLGSSIAFSSPTAVAEVLSYSKDRQKAKEIIEKKAKIEQQIANPQTSNEAKTALSSIALDLNEEATNIYDSAKKQYEAIPEEGKQEIRDLLKSKNELEVAMQDPTLDESVKKDISDKIAELDNTFKEKVDLYSNQIKQNEDKQKNNEANGQVVLGGVRETGNEGEVGQEGEQLREEEVAPKTKELESLVNQIPVEDLRRPNGSIGTQGFTEENMIDVARFISREMGFDIPAFDSSLGTSEIKQLIEYLRGNKEAQQKIKEYVIKNPVVTSLLPDGTYAVEDGNHRANLLNLIGVDVIPTIELNGRDKQTAINEHNSKVEAVEQSLKETPQAGSVGVGGDVESKKSEIEKLNDEIDSFDNEYNSLVDIVNKEDRRLNAPKSENEIKLNELQDKINILRDKREKIEQSLKETPILAEEATEEKLEEVERTPATEANVVKNPILKRLNRGFLKIGTTIFDNAKQLMDKAKELTGKGEKVQFNITMPDGSQKTVKRVHSSVVDGFYSNTENALEQVKQDKMSGNQWATQLLSRGANKEEMAWTGLEGFLKENASKSISKADIQAYLKDNRIQIVEVVKGNSKMSKSEARKVFEDKGYDVITDRNGDTYVEKDEEAFDYNDMSEAEQNAFDVLTSNNSDRVNTSNDTKFSQYQLEGEKENYKEVLVTLPFRKELSKAEQKELDELYSINSADRLPKQNARIMELIDKVQEAPSKAFVSSHFEEPNILVHLRMNTRTDSKGNKVLFLEEIQSDWGQEGKKRGFEQPVNVKAIEELKKEKQKVLDSSKSYQLLNDKTEGNLFVDVFDAIQQIATNMIDNKYSTEESRKKRFLQDIEGTLRYWSSFGNAVPKMNQEELSNFYDVYIKELENNSKKISGYDTSYRLASVENKIKDINRKIFDFGEKSGISTAPFVTDTNAWTKLGLKVALKEAVKQGIKSIAWTTGEQQNDRYDLRKQVDKIEIIKREGADSYRAKTYKNGDILEDQDYIAFDQLEGMFGKEIAKKVQEGESVFEGEGLAVGGKGMKGFYGSPTEGSLGIVGNVAKSLFKQEPSTVNIQVLKPVPANTTVADIQEAGGMDEFKKKNAINSTQNSIDITPELAATVEQGQPLFHYNNKGEILGFTHNGKIYLNGEKITAKTTMEEAGHIWLNWAKENSIDLYKAGLSKVKGSKYLSDVEANKNYQKEALKLGKKGSVAYNTYMREEALAKAIADNGAKFVTETRKNDFIQWVNEMWKQVAQAFGIRNLTTNEIKALSLEEFAKRAAADVFARDQFSDNILDIAEELNKSPQEVERTYNKYLGAKAIEDITIDDYRAARAIGDKNKLEVIAKAFDALLQVENAETSVSPSAKKNAEKSMKEADEKALKEAARIMEHIDEIRSKLQENGVIEAVHCKWGK